MVSLTILIDRDSNNVGLIEARACATRWCAANRRAVLLTPESLDIDFNDLIKGNAP
jgi:hypothetical protein